LFGDSPCARALAQLAKAVGWSVDSVAADPVAHADRGYTDYAAPEIAALAAANARKFAVIATMGEADEDSTVAALSARPEYSGIAPSTRATPSTSATPAAASVSSPNPPATWAQPQGPETWPSRSPRRS